MFLKSVIKFYICSILKLFPIKTNRILFMSYGGKEFSCNPRAMYEYLKSLEEEFEFIWAINDFSKIPDGEKVIKVNPKNYVKYWFYQATSKYAFNNYGFDPYLKRKGTVWINTWHGGGAFKRINWKLNMYPALKQRKILSGKTTDIYVSSSGVFTDFQSVDEFMDKDKFMPTGMPRNDAFFIPQKVEEMRAKGRTFFNFTDEDFVVLYAPTYRGLEETREYDLNFDFHSAYKRFCELTGKNVAFLFRAHRSMLHNCDLKNDFIIDATDYADMQDLLCAADFLITDYSSSIWDYSLLGKPCMLFTPDLKKYQGERGFYTPIESWPYNFFESNEDFIKNLTLAVDREKTSSYQNLVGSYETGHACEKLWKICMEGKFFNE